GWMIRDRVLVDDYVATRVRGDATARVKDLDSAAGEADLDRLAGECVGHAVVVAGELDMVVDVHARLAPLGEAVGSGGQRQQRRALQRLEERAPATFQLLKRTIGQPCTQRRDRGVHLGQAEEGLVPERGEHPSL